MGAAGRSIAAVLEGRYDLRKGTVGVTLSDADDARVWAELARAWEREPDSLRGSYHPTAGES